MIRHKCQCNVFLRSRSIASEREAAAMPSVDSPWFGSGMDVCSVDLGQNRSSNTQWSFDQQGEVERGLAALW